jgi:hypothetical protein
MKLKKLILIPEVTVLRATLIDGGYKVKDLVLEKGAGKS